LIVPPTVEGDKVTTTIKVLGAGDYLPQYAGNLDIINCAAIAMAELIAQSARSIESAHSVAAKEA
jgi:acetaldehyde dehydrogenase